MTPRPSFACVFWCFDVGRLSWGGSTWLRCRRTAENCWCIRRRLQAVGKFLGDSVDGFEPEKQGNVCKWLANVCNLHSNLEVYVLKYLNYIYLHCGLLPSTCRSLLLFSWPCCWFMWFQYVAVCFSGSSLHAFLGVNWEFEITTLVSSFTFHILSLKHPNNMPNLTCNVIPSLHLGWLPDLVTSPSAIVH